MHAASTGMILTHSNIEFGDNNEVDYPSPEPSTNT